MKPICKKHCLILIFTLLLAFPGITAWAQDIKGPVKIVVPYPAGGGTDVIARLCADKMKDTLSTTVIVENKPGAGGRVGTEYVKGLPPDGSAVLVVNPALFVVNPLVFSKLPYDPDKDFEPVSLLQTYQFVLSVPANSPAKDVKGLIEWLKKNPKEANFGSPAAGSLPHFFGLLFAKSAGIELVHASYNGSSPLLTALMGNQVPMSFDAFDTQSAHHPEKIRILATSAAARKLPDVPTFKEQGLDMEGVGWNGIVAPAKTPKAIIDKLSDAFAKAVKTPDVSEKIRQLGSDPAGTDSQTFAALIKADREKWTPVIQASGFKAE